MLEIQQLFAPINKWTRVGIKLRAKKGIALHWTADPSATAKNVATYFAITVPSLAQTALNEGRSDDPYYASAQFSVDDISIWQVMPDDEMAYGVGSKTYTQEALDRLGSYPNDCTISIEMCVDENGQIHEATFQNASDLTAYLIKKDNLTINDIWTHEGIVGWKDCPRPWSKRSGNPAEFERFKSEVAKRLGLNYTPVNVPLYKVFFDGKQQGAFLNKDSAFKFGWSSYNNDKKDTYLTTPEGDKYTFDMHQDDNPDKPNFKVFQYDTFLKPFADQAEAVTYAKLWDHSSVVRISNGEWVWDNYPKDQPKPIPQPQPEPTPIPTPPVTPQPDPQKPKTLILGQAQVIVEQAKQWAKSKGATQKFIDLADIYWKIAPEYNIRPEVAYAQSAKETGFGHFTGVLNESYHNWCGMKNPQGGGDYDLNAHYKFPDDETGVRAHLQHLALYAGVDVKDKIVDPRHFQSKFGSAKTIEELNGQWAPSSDYGDSIVRDYLKPLLDTPDDIDPETKSFIMKLAEFLVKLFMQMISKKKDVQK